MWEAWVQSLRREDPLEKEMVTHSSTLAWKIPWTEEPDRPQSMGLQRVGHDWAPSPAQMSHKRSRGESHVGRVGNGVLGLKGEYPPHFILLSSTYHMGYLLFVHAYKWYMRMFLYTHVCSLYLLVLPLLYSLTKLSISKCKSLQLWVFLLWSGSYNAPCGCGVHSKRRGGEPRSCRSL